MQPIFFAIIAYIIWGSNVFGTIATRKIGPYKTTFWLLLFLIPIYGLFCLLFPNGLQNLTPTLFLLNLFLGIIGGLSLILFYEALRLGNASLVTTISASYPALVVILSIVFLREGMTTQQVIAILIILLGVIISSINFRDVKDGKFKLDAGAVLAIMTMIVWGVYYTFIKIPIDIIGPAWPNLIAALAYPSILIVLKIKNIKIDLKDFKQTKYPLIFNAIFLGGGLLAFNYAVGLGGNVSIVTPISASYPTLFAVVAYFVFKDAINKQQILGIVTTLVGIVLLSVFSV
ncbi:MAG: EamA family transporter [Candidatus Woykebacteria bacterium]